MCLVDPPNLLIVELTSVTKKTSEGCLFRWRLGLAAGRRSCRQCEGKGRLGSRMQTSTSTISTRCVGIVDKKIRKKSALSYLGTNSRKLEHRRHKKMRLSAFGG